MREREKSKNTGKIEAKREVKNKGYRNTKRHKGRVRRIK
jgi:hypothetical protein